MVIEGKKIAQGILEVLKSQEKPGKKLVAVLVGDNTASLSFLKQKEKIANELGVAFRLDRFPISISQIELEDAINKINNDPSVGGVLIQLPLPEGFDRDKILAILSTDKDIDALSTDAKVFALPVEVVKDVLSLVNFDLSKKNVVVIGRGVLVGAPVAKWLQGKCSKLTVLHRGSDFSVIKEADLIISGAGHPGLISPVSMKEGSGFIDFGFGIVDGKIKGDLDVSSPAIEKLSFYTPTPGGTGPMLVAEIFKNFYKLNSL